MKTFLSRSFGVIVMFAMTFNVALATPPPQVTFCHVPPGNEGNPQTITTSQNGYENGHSNHENDYMGPCIGGGSSDTQTEEPSVCESDANLLVNGGFEATDVSAGNWSLFPNGTANLGWSVAWKNPIGAPEVANLEVHDSLWTPVVEGSQYAELDTDFGNPAGGAASVKISQTVATVNGSDYEIEYDFSPRPGTNASQNIIGVWVNGVQVDTEAADGSANAGNAWTHFVVPFTATGAVTTISFSDNGTPDSLGTLIDNVSVKCAEEQEPEECDNLLYARIRTAERGWWNNWGTGNLGYWYDKGISNPPVFVGGTNTLHNSLGGDGYTSQEWFPLVDDETCEAIVDEEFNFDLPGLAVQRLDGSLRVVLYGSHDAGEDPARLINREFAKGHIELSKDMVTKLTGAWDKSNGWVDPIDTWTRIHDPLVNDTENPMDARGNYNGSIHMHHPRYDNVKVLGDLFRFHLVVTTGNDGFYANYNN